MLIHNEIILYRNKTKFECILSSRFLVRRHTGNQKTIIQEKIDTIIHLFVHSNINYPSPQTISGMQLELHSDDRICFFTFSDSTSVQIFIFTLSTCFSQSITRICSQYYVLCINPYCFCLWTEIYFHFKAALGTVYWISGI